MNISIDDLARALGDEFVIVFGSAVSGVMEPYVPMVGQVKQTVLIGFHRNLDGGSLSERLVGGYSRSLAEKSGRYRNLLDRVKFEAFIWRLAQAVGKASVDDLLIKLYGCTGREYGLNHLAMAFLLQKRVCCANLTTNFDNALELCCPGLQVLIHPAKPLHLPDKKDPPLLVKLHGDALTKTAVATSPELSVAKQLQTFAYLEDLLKGKNILVVGYSGIGDVDIAPHLARLDGSIYWAYRDIKPPGGANVFPLLCDLSKETVEENPLIGLAEFYGWTGSSKGIAHQWQDLAEIWVDSQSKSQMRHFVLSHIRWETSWPSVHTAYYRTKESHSLEAQLELGEALTAVAIYDSAEKTLEQILSDSHVDSRSSVRARVLVGFVAWRTGQLSEALARLYPLIRIGFWQNQTDVVVIASILNAARHYLETLNELFAYTPRLVARQQIYTQTNAADAIRALNELPKASAGGDYLARGAVLGVNHAIGNTVSATEVQALFEECFAMQEWAAASIAAQLLASLSIPSSEQAIQKLDLELKARHSQKLRLKNWSALYYEKTGRKIPLLRDWKHGRWPISLLARSTEWVYGLKKQKWDADWNAGILRLE